MLDALRRAVTNSLGFARSHTGTVHPSREGAGRVPSSEPQIDAPASGANLAGAGLLPALQRQQRLHDLYLAVVDSCLRSGLTQWWRQAVSLPFADQAQGAEHLKELCLQQLLHDAGDISAFCRAYEILEQEGYLEGDEHGRYLLELLRFVRRLLKDSRRQSLPDRLARYLATVGRKRAAVISVIVPDDPTLSNFIELCLPSLESESSLKWFLRRRAVTLLVFVRPERLTELERHLAQKALACTIVCRPIPKDLCDDSQIVAGSVKRDWLVGALQCLHLAEAKRLHADFHAINANAIYGSGYFKAVMQLAKRHPSILSAAVWINNRGLLDRKLTNNADKSATISSIDLVTLGLDVCASSACGTFVEGFVSARAPTAHLRVTWAEENRVDIHSTCHELVFLSRASLRRMPDRFFIRPSTDMDRILGVDSVPHVVTEDDGIAIAEFGHPPGGFGDVAGDPAKFEAVTDWFARRRQMELFRRPVRLAVSRNENQQLSGSGQDPVLRRAFVASLEKAAAPGRPSPDRIISALNVLHHYEISEYGFENMAAAIQEGRRLIDSCPSAPGELDEDKRKALIRAAMNVDHVDRAIALAEEGQASTSFIHEFLVDAMKLKAANETRAREMRQHVSPERPFAVVGSIVWGDAFVDKFMSYHIPSLLAAGNLPALARTRKAIQSIVTTEADRSRIVAHPAFKHLGEHAEVIFTCFPEKFLEERKRNHYNFYHFYGLLDHQSVFLASALRAELYLLPVDIVLSRDSLANLSRHLARGADACSIAGIECDPAQLRMWLDGRSRGEGGDLDLAAGELLEAASAVPDPYFRSLIMTADNQAFCRHPRELIWPTADGLAIHSIFMHPVAVSARLMSRPFHPQYENVDFALLPRLLQGDGKLEVLQDAREVAIAQFGAPAEREEFLDTGFSLEAFIDAHRYDYAVQRRCFGTRQFFPSKTHPYSPSASFGVEAMQIQSALRRFRYRLNEHEGA
jgi:hypothetical protein